MIFCISCIVSVFCLLVYQQLNEFHETQCSLSVIEQVLRFERKPAEIRYAVLRIRFSCIGNVNLMRLYGSRVIANAHQSGFSTQDRFIASRLIQLRSDITEIFSIVIGW